MLGVGHISCERLRSHLQPHVSQYGYKIATLPLKAEGVQIEHLEVAVRSESEQEKERGGCMVLSIVLVNVVSVVVCCVQYCSSTGVDGPNLQYRF